ncbi:predicted protein [Histoplasma capsulatum H143]|uniref:Uncharacterized protein n=1 Tax=Ajellomyces capsulatus (strain H143) TaxID=544712 RepID=C6H492_AJECH|nr:predicted protein [Histoplasma capsulatum H143]
MGSRFQLSERGLCWNRNIKFLHYSQPVMFCTSRTAKWAFLNPAPLQKYTSVPDPWHSTHPCAKNPSGKDSFSLRCSGSSGASRIPASELPLPNHPALLSVETSGVIFTRDGRYMPLSCRHQRDDEPCAVPASRGVAIRLPSG